MDKELIRDYELDIIVTAWKDERFRKNLLKDAKKAIENEFKIKVPADMKIAVHEEDENSLHLIVPSLPSNMKTTNLSDDQLKDVIGEVLSTGHLVQFPSSKDQDRLRTLQKENEELRKMIEKLNNDLSALESQLLNQ